MKLETIVTNLLALSVTTESTQVGAVLSTIPNVKPEFAKFANYFCDIIDLHDLFSG